MYKAFSSTHLAVLVVGLHCRQLSWLKSHKCLQIQAKVSVFRSLLGVLAEKNTYTCFWSIKETQWHWLKELEVTLKIPVFGQKVTAFFVVLLLPSFLVFSLNQRRVGGRCTWGSWWLILSWRFDDTVFFLFRRCNIGSVLFLHYTQGEAPVGLILVFILFLGVHQV